MRTFRDTQKDIYNVADDFACNDYERTAVAGLKDYLAENCLEIGPADAAVQMIKLLARLIDERHILSNATTAE